MDLSLRRLAPLGLALVLGACAPPTAKDIGETSEALGYANDQAAFDYFLSQGLSGNQAAAIVGNLDVESGVNPSAVQSGGPGRGIAQWSKGARWDHTSKDNAVWYAANKGVSVYGLNVQLDFIWYELTTFSGYGLASLKASTTISSAVSIFASKFEACGTCNTANRLSNAKRVLAQFGGDVPPPSCTANNVSGSCIDVDECTVMPGYVATAGLCPGSSSIECCTFVGLDGGTDDFGGIGMGDGGASTDDGSSTPTDAGDITTTGTTDPAKKSGCNVSGSRPDLSMAALLVFALAFVRRRRIA